jgi:hypothetical protein
MSNVVDFASRKSKPKNTDELKPPTPLQLEGFIATLQYMVDLNQSDNATVQIDADAEINFTIRGLQDFTETTEVISSCNLEMDATADIDFNDYPSSIKIIQEMLKRIDIDNLPDPLEIKK